MFLSLSLTYYICILLSKLVLEYTSQRDTKYTQLLKDKQENKQKICQALQRGNGNAKRSMKCVCLHMSQRTEDM